MTNEQQPRQLVLIPVDRVPASLRVSARARDTGRAGIAHVRAILADQARRQAQQEAPRRVA